MCKQKLLVQVLLYLINCIYIDIHIYNQDNWYYFYCVGVVSSLKYNTLSGLTPTHSLVWWLGQAMQSLVQVWICYCIWEIVSPEQEMQQVCCLHTSNFEFGNGYVILPVFIVVLFAQCNKSLCTKAARAG